MYILPPLPYSTTALQPVIDQETLKVHHDEIHQDYVRRLNAALKGHDDLLLMDINELMQSLHRVPVAIREEVRIGGGGHYNHSFFWHIVSPEGGGEPVGKLGDKIKLTFISTAAFKEQFKELGLKHFGGGWIWLVMNEGNLEIITTPYEDNPLMGKMVPLVGLDLWEHSYFLTHKNNRADYIDTWWELVDWQAAERHYIA